MSVFERHTLANGLRVLTAPMPTAQSVTCFVMAAAGSRYETRGTNGIAHFTEHMFFKGTERRPTARDLAGEVDAIGGEFNAFTSKEYTGYYVKCAAESRDVALDVLVDMLRRSRFDPAEIDKEKGVILEEMNVYLDTPQRYVGNVYDRLLFGDQPLGWDVLGTKETIEAATRDTFTSYLDAWYKPERIVVGGGVGLAPGLLPRLGPLLRAVTDCRYHLFGSRKEPELPYDKCRDDERDGRRQPAFGTIAPSGDPGRIFRLRAEPCKMAVHSYAAHGQSEYEDHDKVP